MEFSKDSIVSKYFSKKFMGGLNEFEVRDFLHVLAEEIRHLSQKKCSPKKTNSRTRMPHKRLP